MRNYIAYFTKLFTLVSLLVLALLTIPKQSAANEYSTIWKKQAEGAQAWQKNRKKDYCCDYRWN